MPPISHKTPWVPKGRSQGQIGLDPHKMKLLLPPTLGIVIQFRQIESVVITVNMATNTFHVSSRGTGNKCLPFMSHLQCWQHPPLTNHLTKLALHCKISPQKWISLSICTSKCFWTPKEPWDSNDESDRWCFTVRPPAARIRRKYSDLPPAETQPPSLWPRLLLWSLFARLW